MCGQLTRGRAGLGGNGRPVRLEGVKESLGTLASEGIGRFRSSEEGRRGVQSLPVVVGLEGIWFAASREMGWVP